MQNSTTNEKKLRPRNTTADVIRVTDSLLDTDQWITPHEAEAINRKFEKNIYPIFLVEGKTARAFSQLADAYARKLSTKKNAVSIRSTYHQDNSFIHILMYVDGCSAQNFFSNMDFQWLQKFKNASTEGRIGHSIYVIQPDFTLINIRDFGMPSIVSYSQIPSRRAPDFEKEPSIDTQQQEKTEQETKISRPQENKKYTVSKQSWCTKRQNAPRPTPRISNRPRLKPSYVIKFAKLMDRYGQSFDKLLLPLPIDVYKELAEQKQNDKQIKKSSSTTTESKRKSSPRKKLTIEEQREKNRLRQRKFSEKKKREEIEKISKMTPEELEKYKEEKEAERLERNALARMRYRQKIDSMTPEERREYYIKRNQSRDSNKSGGRKQSATNTQVAEETTSSIEQSQSR